jgi:ABC-type multidrug transport system fused ATPase/permease subunit
MLLIYFLNRSYFFASIVLFSIYLIISISILEYFGFTFDDFWNNKIKLDNVENSKPLYFFLIIGVILLILMVETVGFWIFNYLYLTFKAELILNKIQKSLFDKEMEYISDIEFKEIVNRCL